MNYFWKMLHLRCLAGFWICLRLRLQYLKSYLFSQNTKTKSFLPHQFGIFFTVFIRTRSRDSIIAMSIISDHLNIIKSWGSQESMFLSHAFILKIILHNLDVFHDIWVKFQDLKKELALTLFRSQLFQYYLHTRFPIYSGFNLAQVTRSLLNKWCYGLTYS